MGQRKPFLSSVRALYKKGLGIGVVTGAPSDYGIDNSTPLAGRNAADTADINLIGVDSDDKVRVADAAITPALQTIKFALATTAQLTTQAFFIAPYAMKIKSIQQIHATAESTATTLTAHVTKETGTEVPGAGVAVMSNTFNCKSTANTAQAATLQPEGSGYVTLAAGDRLSVKFSAAATELAGFVLTVVVAPGGKGDFATFAMKLNANLVDQCFYIANRRQKIKSIRYVHSTKGTNGSAVNVQVTKDISTNAPGAGTDLLTNNTNAGFDCKGTVNTVQSGSLSATVANLWLSAGDRLSVDFSGTTTALAGVVITVEFEPLYEKTKDVTFNLSANAELADQAFFIADRAYEILDARYVNATAGNDGGAVNVQLTAGRLTDAPGAGSDLLTNNTNAGFDCKGTANTVEVAALGVLGVRFLNAGDRLSVDFAGTLTTLAGVVITITLRHA